MTVFDQRVKEVLCTSTTDTASKTNHPQATIAELTHLFKFSNSINMMNVQEQSSFELSTSLLSQTNDVYCAGTQW